MRKIGMGANGQAPRGKTSVLTMGCAVLIVVSVLPGIWFAINPAPSKPSTAIPAPAPVPKKDDPEAAKRFEECRAKLKASTDMLRDLSWKSGALPPRVVVGPTFFAVDFKTKEGFADTVNCFLMAGEPKFINFDLLDWKNEKVIATYAVGRLKMK